MNITQFLIDYNNGLEFGYPEDIVSSIRSYQIPDFYKEVDEDIVYRGIYFESLEDLKNLSNDQKLFNHLNKLPTSWTSRVEVAEKFANIGRFGIVISKKTSEINVLFNFNKLSLEDKKALKYPNENEILIEPTVGVCDVLLKVGF